MQEAGRFGCYGLILASLAGCASSPTDPDPVEITPGVEATPPTTDPTLAMESEGWAPVFRTERGLEALGKGTVMVGPSGVQPVESTSQRGECGGRILSTSDRAVLVLPEGAHPTDPPQAATVQASQVETAAWRLHEVLPSTDSTASPESVTQPARQKGVEVGSVSKVRRHGAPPIFLVSGVRDCTAGVLVLDKELGTTLDHYSFEGICDPVAVMPPSDLDGDGLRELVVFNPQFVGLLRLLETPGSVSLQFEARWSCNASNAER